MNKVSATVVISNMRGLHARSSAKFVGVASTFSVVVHVEKDGQCVEGTSIMGLMMLGAAKGEEITISAEGAGAADAVQTLAALVTAKFGED